MPIISVIVPNYNNEQYIEECIMSLTVQTINDIEIIVVDDGSVDSSGEIVSELQKKDNRIKLIKKVNGGVSSARNAGIEAATGTYLMFVDADDYVTPDCCEVLLNAMVAENVDFVVTRITSHLDKGEFYETSLKVKSGTYLLAEILPFLISDTKTISTFAFSSVCKNLYKKSIIQMEGISFDEKIHYNEDGLFNVHYCLNVKSLTVLNRSVYIQHCNLNSATQTVRRAESSFAKRNKSMDDVDIKLRMLSASYPQYCLEKQINSRYINMIEGRLHLSLTCFNKGKEEVKSILSDKRFKESIKEVSILKINVGLHRRIKFFLMKTRQITLLYIFIKYMLPFARLFQSGDQRA